MELQVRRAEEKDIPRVLSMLHQVLEIHAGIRPDIFIPGTTKYTAEELKTIFENESTPVFVAADENDAAIGYVFCRMETQPAANNMKGFDYMYIDDLCVDEAARGRGVGRALYGHILSFAREKGCHNVTLNVWSCNPGAMRFYEKLGLTPYKVGMEQIL